MKKDFTQAKRVLRTNTAKVQVVAVNGCCYGKDDTPDKGEYLKLCGQRFWEFVSGSTTVYTDIVEPLGHRAREKNEEFAEVQVEIHLPLAQFAEDADQLLQGSARICCIEVSRLSLALCWAAHAARPNIR
jgi:hypothetical protein